jgi:hypothetical protein
MEKLDLRKQFKHLYAPTAKKVEVVDVPPLKFALVDGEIEPGASPGISPAYQEAIQALYGISFTLKFMSKLRKEDPIDYGVDWRGCGGGGNFDLVTGGLALDP